MGYSFNGLVFIERISITLTHRNLPSVKLGLRKI